MSPAEWHLLLDGRANERKRLDRQTARWVSPIVSAIAGHVFTPEQLLGEEPTEESPDKVAADVREAEKRLRVMQRRIAKQQKKGR